MASIVRDAAIAPPGAVATERLVGVDEDSMRAGTSARS